MNNNTDKKKEQRQNLYVTVTVILMMVAVIVAIAVSLAKTSREIENMKYKEETTSLSGKADESRKEKYSTDTESENSVQTEDVFLKENEDKNTESATESDAEKEPSRSDVTTDTKKESVETEAKADNTSEKLQFTVPVKGEILKGVSFDVPVFSRTMEDYRTHTGVDIYCEAGTDVASVAAGTIKEIWEDPMMGTCISIEHPGGMMSVYKNLCSDIPEKTSAGKQVNCGEIFATSGDTALLEVAEESHLHYELYLNGEAVDPCQYIEFPTEPVMAEVE